MHFFYWQQHAETANLLLWKICRATVLVLVDVLLWIFFVCFQNRKQFSIFHLHYIRVEVEIRSGNISGNLCAYSHSLQVLNECDLRPDLQYMNRRLYHSVSDVDQTRRQDSALLAWPLEIRWARWEAARRRWELLMCWQAEHLVSGFGGGLPLCVSTFVHCYLSQWKQAHCLIYAWMNCLRGQNPLPLVICTSSDYKYSPLLFLDM